MSSTCGYALNNPGNLRFIANPKRAWNGQVAEHQGFGRYDTPQNGTRALGHQLLHDQKIGALTIRALITVGSPPSENDTEAYIRAVLKDLQMLPGEERLIYDLSLPGKLSALARAIAHQENGYIDATYDWAWVYIQ